MERGTDVDLRWIAGTMQSRDQEPSEDPPPPSYPQEGPVPDLPLSVYSPLRGLRPGEVAVLDDDGDP